jgi:hypothetical protein
MNPFEFSMEDRDKEIIQNIQKYTDEDYITYHTIHRIMGIVKCHSKVSPLVEKRFVYTKHKQKI